jgi:hypothetical protein
MPQLTANKVREYSVEAAVRENVAPITTSTEIFEGSALGFTAGNVRQLVGGDPFAGFALRYENHTLGARDVPVRKAGLVRLPVTGATAITDVGLPVYATDGDTFTLAAGGSYIGRIVSWISGTTCVVEFCANEYLHVNVGVVTKTASYTIQAAESGTIFTNTGATGAITFTLPVATPGLRYSFVVGVAQNLIVDPNGTNQVSVVATGVPAVAGKHISADAIGEALHLVCALPGVWSFAATPIGTWTVEA